MKRWMVGPESFIAQRMRCLSWLPALLARVTLGWVFVESGYGKVGNLAEVTGYFTSLGIPMPAFNAAFAAWSELVFGALVFVGFFTRLASVPLIIIMIVAILTAKAEELTGFSSLTGMIEYLYIVLLVWLFVDGPGKISVDALLGGSSKKE